jgi:hypothetical protein
MHSDRLWPLSNRNKHCSLFAWIDSIEEKSFIRLIPGNTLINLIFKSLMVWQNRIECFINVKFFWLACYLQKMPKPNHVKHHVSHFMGKLLSLLLNIRLAGNLAKDKHAGLFVQIVI